MRLVIDEIRGKSVNDALAYLQFSKKHAAKAKPSKKSTTRHATIGARHCGHVRELGFSWSHANAGVTLVRSSIAPERSATDTMMPLHASHTRRC